MNASSIGPEGGVGAKVSGFVFPPRFYKLLGQFRIHFSRRFCVVLAGIAFLWLFLLIEVPRLSGWLDRELIDLAQWVIRPWRASHPDVMIVAIDDSSAKSQGEPWPWSRLLQAKLLEKIGAGKPRLIVFDILLQHPEAPGGSPGDRKLEQSIRELGNVGLIAILEDSKKFMGDQVQQYSAYKPFRKAAAFEGFVWTVVDEDRKTRSFVARDDRLGRDSCAVQIASRFRPGLRLPVFRADQTARSFLAFTGKGGGIPVISAHEVLTGSQSAEIFRDRIVLLGVTARAARDYHLTAFGELPGTVILATSLDTLLSDRILESTEGRMPPLMLVLLGSFLGFRLTLASYRYAETISLACMGVFTFTFLASAFLPGFFPQIGVFCLSWLSMTLAIIAFERFFRFLEYRHMQKESGIVGEIQKKFFPAAPWVSPSGYECHGLCLPCEEAGGDYFDFFELNESELFFAIGDVTGHGFAAGMVTAMAKTVITWLEMNKKLDVERGTDYMSHTLIYSFQRTKLMTGILGRLNMATHQVSLRFSGHLPVYHIDVHGNTKEVACPGFPFGVPKRAKSAAGKTMEILMNPGDTLVLYTDGVTEAVNWTDDQYSFDRWQNFLGKTAASTSSVSALIGLAFEEVRRHAEGRPFTDDVTMVVLRRNLV